MEINLKILAILLCLLFIHNFALYSDELTIDFLEGYLEKKEGSKWIELFENDTIDAKAVVRLKNDSMAELSGNDVNITLIRSGTYHLDKIIAESQMTSSYGLDEILSSKFAALTSDSEDENTEGAVMGVRAANIEEEVDFIGDEVVETIFRTAKDKIKKHDYKGALSLLEDAYDWADEDNGVIIIFYIGYCYNKLGNEALAITYLMDVDIDAEMPFYPDYVILFGSLLMKSFAYEDALALFLDYIKVTEGNDSFEYQNIHYLTALCYINKNNSEDALRYLKKTRQINPDTETGKKAGDLLKSL